MIGCHILKKKCVCCYVIEWQHSQKKPKKNEQTNKTSHVLSVSGHRKWLPAQMWHGFYLIIARLWRITTVGLISGKYEVYWINSECMLQITVRKSNQPHYVVETHKSLERAFWLLFFSYACGDFILPGTRGWKMLMNQSPPARFVCLFV